MFNTEELINTRKMGLLVATMNQREDLVMKENLPLENYNRLEELATLARPRIAGTAPEMGRFGWVLKSIATKEDFVALITDMLNISVADISSKTDQEIIKSHEHFQGREHNPSWGKDSFEYDARNEIQLSKFDKAEISMDECLDEECNRNIPRQEVAEKLEELYRRYRAGVLQKRVQHVATLLVPYVLAANQSLGKDTVRLADLEKEVIEGPQPLVRMLT